MIIFFNKTGSKELARVNGIIIPRIGETVQLNLSTEKMFDKQSYKVVDVEYRYSRNGLDYILVFLGDY